MEIVGSFDSAVALLLAARELLPDIIVVSLQEDGRMPGVCSHLAEEYPRLLLAGISDEHISSIIPSNGQFQGTGQLSAMVLVTTARTVVQYMR